MDDTRERDEWGEWIQAIDEMIAREGDPEPPDFSEEDLVGFQEYLAELQERDAEEALACREFLERRNWWLGVCQKDLPEPPARGGHEVHDYRNGLFRLYLAAWLKGTWAQDGKTMRQLATDYKEAHNREAPRERKETADPESICVRFSRWKDRKALRVRKGGPKERSGKRDQRNEAGEDSWLRYVGLPAHLNPRVEPSRRLLLNVYMRALANVMADTDPSFLTSPYCRLKKYSRPTPSQLPLPLLLVDALWLLEHPPADAEERLYGETATNTVMRWLGVAAAIGGDDDLDAVDRAHGPDKIISTLLDRQGADIPEWAILVALLSSLFRHLSAVEAPRSFALLRQEERFSHEYDGWYMAWLILAPRKLPKRMPDYAQLDYGDEPLLLGWIRDGAWFEHRLTLHERLKVILDRYGLFDLVPRLIKALERGYCKPRDTNGAHKIFSGQGD